ncbi:MAG: hypothetical protein COB93_00180 [Sneathiella sp.]|nr:MAG: hypothetical protein COB93_00180 [Sneathiella sp.]
MIILVQCSECNTLRIADMERDMDLVRKIFLAIQKKADLIPRSMEIEGFDEALVARHFEMLLHAGYIDGTSQQLASRASPTIFVKDMSWEGHDFLAAIAEDTVFAKLKAGMGKTIATVPLSVIKDTAVALAGAYAKSQFDLS